MRFFLDNANSNTIEFGVFSLKRKKSDGLLVGFLDDYMTGLLGAWSTQKMFTDYEGPIVTIINEDEEELDIYNPTKFAPIYAHIGTGNGYLKRRWDQTGSGNHEVYPSKARMPLVAYRGTIITINGKLSAHYGRPGAFEDSTKGEVTHATKINPINGHRLIVTVKKELREDSYYGFVDKNGDSDGYGIWHVPIDTFPFGTIVNVDGNRVSSSPTNLGMDFEVIGQFYNPSLTDFSRQAVFVNGVQKGVGYGPNSATGNTSNLTVGDAVYRHRGYINDIILYDNTGPSIATISAAIESLYTRQDHLDLWFDGNSLTFGNGSTFTTGNDTGERPVYTYPNALRMTQPGDWRVHNMGVSERAMPTMLANLQTAILDNLDATAAARVVVFWEGVNDILTNSRSPEDEYQLYVDYAAEVQGAGAIAVTMTSLPFASHVPSSEAHAAKAAAVSAFNNLLRADNSFVDIFIDLAAESVFDPTDLTIYQSDGIHLTDKGYWEVAKRVRQALIDYFA